MYNNQNNDQSYDYLFKVTLIGDAGVGKSNLLNMLTGLPVPQDYKETIGVDFKTITIEVGGKKVKLQIRDTAGADRYRAMTSAYYRGTVVALLTFDLTNRNSFKNLEKWLTEARENCGKETKYILVGTKADLDKKREVTAEEMEAFVKRNNIDCQFETSAKTGTGIDELLKKTAELGISEEKQANNHYSFHNTPKTYPSEGNGKLNEKALNDIDKIIDTQASSTTTATLCCNIL